MSPETYSWVPTVEQLEAANVVRLARRLGCTDFEALHRVSVEEPARVWRAGRGDHAPRGATRRARDRRERRSRDLPPDVAGSGDRFTRVRTPRSDPGPHLLGL